MIARIEAAGQRIMYLGWDSLDYRSFVLDSTARCR